MRGFDARRATAIVAGAVAIAVAGGAAQAQASTVSLFDDQLDITDSTGANDVIVLSSNGTTLTVTDTGPGGAIAGNDCTQVNPTTVTCPINPPGESPVDSFDVALGPGTDSFTNQNFAATGFIEAFAQEGAKTINAGPGDQFVNGGIDDDRINGGDGNDSLGDGSGFADPTGGNDVLNGGPGSDATGYFRNAPVTITLDGQANDGQAGEADNVQVENVVGGPADDTIIGDEGANLLGGDGGDDVIRGMGGNDELFGDIVFGFTGGAVARGAGVPTGNDTLDGGAGADGLDCGLGFDLALRDPLDTVAANCERIGAKVAGDSARVTGKKKNKFKVRISCPASELKACSGKLAVTADERRIGKGKFSVPNGQTKRAKVKLNKKGRKALRKAKGTLLVSVTVTTTEPGGVAVSVGRILIHR